MTSIYNRKENCFGCSACESICATKAVTLKDDSEGFYYPIVNPELCIDCGLCIDVCPEKSNDTKIDTFQELKIYAVKHKNHYDRMQSASGGIYTAISDKILHDGGKVYGVKFDEKFKVIHSMAINKYERDKFRGSKYVQSYLGDTFIQIRNDLMQGHKVLFSGTGCQVAGLKNYLLTKDVCVKNLITNDIICHGIASPKIWNDYLNSIQKNCKIKNYTFRFKDISWYGYNVKATYLDGKIKVNTPLLRTFINLFQQDLNLRPSCYECRFANIIRVGDISIGDYWGIQRSMPLIDDNRGISLVILSTNKGKDLFTSIQNDIFAWESNTTECLQPNLVEPTKMPNFRQKFWFDYYDKGYMSVAKKYGKLNIFEYVKYYVKFVIRRNRGSTKNRDSTTE